MFCKLMRFIVLRYLLFIYPVSSPMLNILIIYIVALALLKVFINPGDDFIISGYMNLACNESY